MSQNKTKNIPIRASETIRLENCNIENKWWNSGLKSAFFFLWCVTKLLEFELELGIESFQKIIDSRCYKKTLNRKYFLKMDKTKTALDEQETSAAIIKTFDTMYHFER